MKKRNTLTELYRILFALCILCYHNFFPVNTPYFSGANYLVEYFFFLTGYFCFRLFERNAGGSLLRGTLRLGMDRLQKLGIPLLLAWLCNMLYCILAENGRVSLHYLWFIHIMILALCAYYIVFRLCKQNKKFMLIVAAAVLIISECFRMTDAIYLRFNEGRGVAAISLGIIFSCLPSLQISSKRMQKLCLPLSLMFLVLIAFNNLLAMKPETKRICELIFDLVLMPGLVLTALNTSLPFSLPSCTEKCALYIYIWQCAARLLALWTDNKWLLFGSVLVLTAVCCTADFIKEKRLKNASLPSPAYTKAYTGVPLSRFT